MQNSRNKIVRRLLLNATPGKVWHALTNPDQTKKYMFNCEVYSNWELGSEIKWKGNHQGYESGEQGEILEIEQNKTLKYSSIDPNFGIEIKPENFLHITYDLKENKESTELTITIESFNNDQERMEHLNSAWDKIILPSLEKIFN